jgi:hypothetical protein
MLQQFIWEFSDISEDQIRNYANHQKRVSKTFDVVAENEITKW